MRSLLALGVCGCLCLWAGVSQAQTSCPTDLSAVAPAVSSDPSGDLSVPLRVVIAKAGGLRPGIIQARHVLATLQSHHLAGELTLTDQQYSDAVTILQAKIAASTCLLQAMNPSGPGPATSTNTP